ncbi:MAG: hypothetical protein ACYCW6_05665 [Candidatus Xenobia bacterium]
MNTWLQALMVLGLLSIPVQALAALRMHDDITRGFRELGEQHGRDMASALGLLAFIGWAMLPAWLQHGDPLKFHMIRPLSELYLVFKGILPVPTDHHELKAMYMDIWKALTFVLPCLMYIGFNAGLASFIWERTRYSKI